MVLESTMVCVDNSDYMRNGDFLPTRLHAQQDAVNVICMSKTRANPENNVGLLSAANNTEVLVTLTTDTNKVLARLHQMQPKGQIHFTSAVRVAHLVLKHRQGKNHRMRIVVFVGSPIPEDEKELVKLAKKLRKEKVNVDIVNFGEEAINTDKLTAFINALNGTDGNSSHLVTVPAGPLLSDALVSSQIVVGEDGSGAMLAGGFEFGIDPNEDPELALALRVSMEEQRARQDEEARKANATAAAELEASGNKPAGEESMEEQLLRQTLARSLQQSDGGDVDMTETSGSAPPTSTNRDLSAMTEEEQMEYALQMSLQQASEAAAMEEDQAGGSKAAGGTDEDYSEVMNDAAFLQSVLEDLPGVNPQDEAVKEAVKQLTKPSDDKSKKDEKK